MKSKEIWVSQKVKSTFLDFFEKKQHQTVPSDSILIKNDPTLMFTNAGMNQFKSYFLGTESPEKKRVANSQRCLRVSGKHNDLEEVGHDTYHHTMFEMLGNWSFGDYFKKEAIEWAWELLVEVYGIDPNRIYVTVFGGSKEDTLDRDHEAIKYWEQCLSKERILAFDKKDNFWEMGTTGPCGPCSEIHIDIRTETERNTIDGKTLVNQDHPEVIEIWNLVFIQYNRLENGNLEPLPEKHIDTGMGFERLCMILQGKKSNYDIDTFQTLIGKIESLGNKKYGNDNATDVAFRVVADHLRAVAFAIFDGQLPSNNKAGYVVKRILRRAIRYSYSFLEIQEPFIYRLVKTLSTFFPELKQSQTLLENVIKEEEETFLRTLDRGIKKFEKYVSTVNHKIVSGEFAFTLYDTYGFPLDLTEILAKEKGFKVETKGFQKEMELQKKRSQKNAETTEGDWISFSKNTTTKFLGYEAHKAKCKVLRYKKVTTNQKQFLKIVLDQTPFYSESGGQIGDTGSLILNNGEKMKVFDTQKENNAIIHYVAANDFDPKNIFQAEINHSRREKITKNHSATHLMHEAMREVLGDHVEQKGSLVNDEKLRFDFSHFQKVDNEQLSQIENIVNTKIQENIFGTVQVMELEKAKEMGAKALFGEKYGKTVRVVTFDEDFSVELCGGTHVDSTADIAYFKIISESSVASGIRRIEAKTSNAAIEYISQKSETLDLIAEKIKTSPKNTIHRVTEILNKNKSLQKEIDTLHQITSKFYIETLSKNTETIHETSFISHDFLNNTDTKTAKNILQKLTFGNENTIVFLGVKTDSEYMLHLGVGKNISQIEAHTLSDEISKAYSLKGGGNKNFSTLIAKNNADFLSIRDFIIKKINSLHHRK